MNAKENYEYRIKQCLRPADAYGPCERCGKPGVHYKQQYRDKEWSTSGWAISGYGHLECLRNGHWANAEVINNP